MTKPIKHLSASAIIEGFRKTMPQAVIEPACTCTTAPTPNITAEIIIETIKQLRSNEPTPDQIRVAKKVMGRDLTPEEMQTLRRLCKI